MTFGREKAESIQIGHRINFIRKDRLCITLDEEKYIQINVFLV
jgi:hypothetical protein